MGEKQAIVKLREDGESIRAIAQTLAQASTTIWNVLRKKETTGVLSNRPRTGRPRKTSAVDDRNIVTAVKKDPKTTVSDISKNLQRAGYSNCHQFSYYFVLRIMYKHLLCKRILQGSTKRKTNDSSYFLLLLL
uniref:Transposase IS30-like HTH domain-containing protein n=1 Tax=Sinocyclocheilus rhinocerous TaxID=307959 RepID=A0A673FSC5_9TELE